ncbi:MAG: Crp/Fnr family transcriptional regulator [Hyphomicrobiaceae bacterium]
MPTVEPWTVQFPSLSLLPVAVRDRLIRSSKVVELPEGSRLFGPGQAPESFLLLLDGTVRVQQVSENGREIVLYRVAAGETCALTTACLMGYEDYQAEAISETDVRAVAIARSAFDDLIASSIEFRRFVFTAFSQRVTNLFRVIDEVAFGRIDARLAQRLLQLADPQGRVEATHQQLASELGSAREVISRQLTEFQRRDWIKVLRGSVEISDHAALTRLSEQAH